MNGLNHVSIVLVSPKMPENAGMAARSMLAFGFDQLRIVQPRFALEPDSPAYKTCCGADSILDQAKIVSTFHDAVADCHKAVGFSRRSHTFPRSKRSLEDWVEHFYCHDAEKNVALVFGPEDFGLANEEKKICAELVEIPLSHPTLSLNLSHAISIVLHRLFNHQNHAKTPHPPEPDLADLSGHCRLMKRIEPMIQEMNRKNPGKNTRYIESIRSSLQRSNLTREELGIWMKLLSKREYKE